jgi:hypothetical protein
MVTNPDPDRQDLDADPIQIRQNYADPNGTGFGYGSTTLSNGMGRSKEFLIRPVVAASHRFDKEQDPDLKVKSWIWIRIEVKHWIRIRIEVKSLIRIRIEVKSWIRLRFEVKSWTRIRIEVKSWDPDPHFS